VPEACHPVFGDVGAGLVLTAQAQKEALIAAALDKDEKRQLNALLRRLMLEFERREQGPS
jgi:3-oxoacyl-[acyl-carrier-protein] synthase III